MTKYTIRPSGRESPFHEEEIIVSKTDLKGRITYVNDVFLRVSKYAAAGLLGEPHSIIRHPDMPRCVFKLLWETLQAKGEMFAYILNMASDGDHYWVFAHITPSFDADGNVTGYHSNRRKPEAPQIARIEPFYKSLLREEQGPSSRKAGMQLAHARFLAEMKNAGMSYDEYVFAI